MHTDIVYMHNLIHIHSEHPILPWKNKSLAQLSMFWWMEKILPFIPDSFILPPPPSLRSPLQTQGPPLALTVLLQWLSISRIISSWGLVISCCGPGGVGWPGFSGQCLSYKRLLLESRQEPLHPSLAHPPPPFDPIPALSTSSSFKITTSPSRLWLSTDPLAPKAAGPIQRAGPA